MQGGLYIPYCHKKWNDVYLNHKNHMTFHGKECLVKVCVLHHAAHHLQSCLVGQLMAVFFSYMPQPLYCKEIVPSIPWTGGWRYGPLRQLGCCGSRDVIAAKWK